MERLIAIITIASLIFFSSCAATTSEESNINRTISNNSDNNFNCPLHCQCVLALNTHRPLLHAKCTSIDDLQSDTPLRASLPVHSIDLSYLGLSRLSHSLEKLHDLTSVDLSHNELHDIGHLGRRIKKLNLKHNRITSSKLPKMPQHVQVLNLQHNDITHLPLEVTKLAQLHTLELGHNPINCTCETLEVRNWLQLRHVFMENPVKCFYPAAVRGKSWLQVKQSDICDKEKRGWYADAEAGENELMLGDQPIEDGSETHDDDNEDELGKSFMPINQKMAKSAHLKLSEDLEGSGDLNEINLPFDLEPSSMIMARSANEGAANTSQEADEDEDYDGSGSGGGMLVIPQLAQDVVVPEDFDQGDSHEHLPAYGHQPPHDAIAHDGLDQPDSQEHPPARDELGNIAPLESRPSVDIFGNGMGIFDGDENSASPVTEDEIRPVVHHHNELAVPPVGEEEAESTEAEPVGTTEGLVTEAGVVQAEVAPSDDNSATYYLLGVVVLVVVGLIFYVALKRCKKNRSSLRDAENPRSTELLDMDKKNLGKPMQRNGNATEQAPLIGEKSKSDLAKPISGAGKKSTYDGNDAKDGPSTQQPLLNGNGNGNLPSTNATNKTDTYRPTSPSTISAGTQPHEYHPITPRYPPPKSPRASKYGLHEPNNNNEDILLSSSPKSGRYSPVYSPETGRVKIKLTETPKPKTPMLVTRSKSNAGDIVTTPIHTAQLLGAEVAPVGGVGGANGHIEH